jgi:GntR family transcriptional regulator, transcriptional repressor for pyruvate dehydrogenase complex
MNRRKKAYEEIADCIRGEILAGNLTLGQRLPSEQELAEQFGNSRAAVREAIRTLEGTGFVTVKKGNTGGTFVAQNYDKPVIDSIGHMVAAGEVNFDDLFVVRSLVECYAAERLALHGSQDEIGPLEALLDAADQALAAGENIRHYNIRFHRTIIRSCGNPLLVVMGETAITTIMEQLAPMASRELSLTHRSMHREILTAIKTGDAARAKTLIDDDIKSLRLVVAEKLPHLITLSG